MFKSSFFIILVLIEVVLLLLICHFLMFSLPIWVILPLLCLGASESSIGLAVSASLARCSSPASFSM